MLVDVRIDSRRAIFKFKDLTYAAKLVDLPNVIEGQKTLDNKHLFKIADISQVRTCEQLRDR